MNTSPIEHFFAENTQYNTMILEILILIVILAIAFIIQYKFLKKNLSKMMVSSLGEIMDHRISINSSIGEERISEEVKQTDKNDVLKVKLSEKHFHEEVIKIYSKFLEEPQRFFLTDIYLIVPDSKAKIWASNEVENRRFEVVDYKGKYSSLLISDLSVDVKQFDVEEINNQLTLYDKMLLEKIVRKVKEYQDNSIKELFEN